MYQRRSFTTVFDFFNSFFFSILASFVLARYVISFSLALAILNVVPCFYLDGQWIAKALIEHGCGDRVAAARKEALATAVVGAGTVLLFTCVLLGFYQVLKN